MTLALTEERLNHLAPAESLMQEAIDLKVAAYGPAHPTTLSTKGVMAMFLARHGRGEEALRLAREGVAHARRWPDGAREILPETLTNLGRLLLMEGRPAEAERYVLEAKSLYESVYGPDHARIGGTEDLLADLSLARGDTVEAARHLREAYRISSLWVGLDHPTVKAYAARLIDLGEPISRSP